MTNFINIENQQNKTKVKNFFFISLGFGFIWILFHFTVIFFFGAILQSVLLTGLFLGFGNFVALVIDIPIGVALKYIKSKTMFLIATFLLLLEGIIFFKFVLFSNLNLGKDFGTIGSFLDIFLDSGINLVLLILCSAFYGIIKEIFDVTSLSYLMNHSSGDEFAENLSKSNTFFGGGALLGLILSGVILSLDPFISVLILVIFICLYFIFLLIFFDNQDYSISLQSIKNFKLNEVVDGEKQISTINKERLRDIFTKISNGSGEMKSVFINPMKLKDKFEFKEFLKNSLSEFGDVKKTLLSKPFFLPLIWLIIVINFFGFLDTFIATFQVDFLEKVLGENSDSIVAKMANAYILLGILVVPVFVTQIFFINLSKKYGVQNIILLGMMVSGVSLIGFGITQNILLIMLSGIGNSLGYAAAMPLSQSSFSEKYSEHYSHIKNLKEIDANASAAPLKILLNFANVLGLIFGGLIVSLLNFNGFFIVYGISLLILLYYTYKNKDKYKL